MKRPLFLEPNGQATLSGIEKGAPQRYVVPLYEAKPLEMAHPSAEELAAYIKATGNRLIHYTLKTEVNQPVRTISERGPTFTTHKTVPDGPAKYRLKWVTELLEVEFKP